MIKLEWRNGLGVPYAETPFGDYTLEREYAGCWSVIFRDSFICEARSLKEGKILAQDNFDGKVERLERMK